MCTSRAVPAARGDRAGQPQSNGFIECFRPTSLEEHLRAAGRTKWYETVEEMKKDPDVYRETYDRACPHRGRGMDGRMPYPRFTAGLNEAKAARARPPRQEEKGA